MGTRGGNIGSECVSGLVTCVDEGVGDGDYARH